MHAQAPILPFRSFKNADATLQVLLGILQASTGSEFTL